MKQCENCGGALDDKGKCMACGKINEFKLDSNDGQVIYGLPEGFIDMLNKIKVPHPDFVEEWLKQKEDKDDE
jgi:hypothetical protein